LTQPDGSLSQVWNHGLDRTPWTRGRFVYPLKAYDGEQLVLITVDLGPLPTGAGFINDGLQKNHNELYRRVPKQAEGAYFVRLNMTVFEEELNTDYVQVSDYDGDGVDDLFIAVRTGHGYRNARIYLQNKTNGHFVCTELPNTENFQRVQIIVISVDLNPPVESYIYIPIPNPSLSPNPRPTLTRTSTEMVARICSLPFATASNCVSTRG